jgi:hypothetical protein
MNKTTTTNIVALAIWMAIMVSYIKGETKVKGIYKKDCDVKYLGLKRWEWDMEKTPQ